MTTAYRVCPHTNVWNTSVSQSRCFIPRGSSHSPFINLIYSWPWISFPLPKIIPMPLKDMQQFNCSLLSSELPVTESFWQDVFTFRSKPLSDESEPRALPPPPKEANAPQPQPSRLRAASLSVCEGFFSLCLDLRTVVSPHCDSPGALGLLHAQLASYDFLTIWRNLGPLATSWVQQS